jgi:multiple sugar transport system ATP-binding protein
VTTIYVTHDQVEAMTMGTRIAVMRKGVLQQQGPPQDLYDDPVNLFVATFIGSPAMNLFRARVGDSGDRLSLELREQRLELPGAAAVASFRGRDVAVGIRPEHLAAEPSPESPRLEVSVVQTETLGAERLLHVALAADPVATEHIREVASDVDQTLLEDLAAESKEHAVTLVARVDVGYAPEPGETIELGIRPDRVHSFDLDTGDRIR